jgi:hypothetical protein
MTEFLPFQSRAASLLSSWTDRMKEAFAARSSDEELKHSSDFALAK